MINTAHSTVSFFFFNDTATTEIYTLSLHDALPISQTACSRDEPQPKFAPASSSVACAASGWFSSNAGSGERSEEHTSELQSQSNLVCRLLLEKKKNKSLQCKIWIYWIYSM